MCYWNVFPIIEAGVSTSAAARMMDAMHWMQCFSSRLTLCTYVKWKQLTNNWPKWLDAISGCRRKNYWVSSNIECTCYTNTICKKNIARFCLTNTNSNNYSCGNHFFKVLVQIHYSHAFKESFVLAWVLVFKMNEMNCWCLVCNFLVYLMDRTHVGSISNPCTHDEWKPCTASSR